MVKLEKSQRFRSGTEERIGPNKVFNGKIFQMTTGWYYDVKEMKADAERMKERGEISQYRIHNEKLYVRR